MDLVAGRYQHGTRTAYSKGKCRCPECRAAAAKYQRDLRKNGPKPKAEPGHGTVARYARLKCRCEPCTQAKRSYLAVWRANNPDKVSAAQDAWSARNPGKAAERSRAWRAENREAHRAYSRGWRKENLEHVHQRDQRYYQENREKLVEYQREYQKSNPAQPALRKAIKSRRRHRELVEMDAMDRALSVAYREAIKNDLCSYCNGPGRQDDHIRPLKRGGTDHWWNLTRSCAPCNQSKGAKLLDEWPGRPMNFLS